MKLNKNVLVSIVFIGMVSCLITAGTLACSTAKPDPISNTKSAWLVIDGVAANPKCSNTIVPGTQVYNIYPENFYKQMHTFKIQNKGNQKGKLYVQFVPTTQTLGKGSGVKIKLDNVVLYDNGVNKASKPICLYTVPAATKKGYGCAKATLRYEFPDNGRNQNNWEGKTLRFNIVFTLK